MTLEQYIETFEKPDFKIEVDTFELLDLMKELKHYRTNVQPVKHGRWEYMKDKYGNDYICSNCKNKNDERTWFCPYCGVDMREDCYEHRKS